MDMVLLALPMKLAASVALWGMVQQTTDAYAGLTAEQGPPWSYMGPLVLLMLVNEIAGTLMFVSLMSFFSKISDPSIGGSYMTLLNTLTNLGAKWPSALALWLLPKMTFHVCATTAMGTVRQILPFKCSMKDAAVCGEHGGICQVEMVSEIVGRNLLSATHVNTYECNKYSF